MDTHGKLSNSTEQEPDESLDELGEKKLSDDTTALPEMVAALSDLRTLYAEKLAEYTNLGEDLDAMRQFAELSLSGILRTIQLQFDQNNLAIDVAASLWAEATGKEYPDALVANFKKIYKGMPIIGTYVEDSVKAIVAERVEVSWENQHEASMKAYAEDGKTTIFVVEGYTYIGSEAISDLLCQTLENYAEPKGSTRTSLDNLVRYYTYERAAGRVGVPVPDGLIQQSHILVGETIMNSDLKGNAGFEAALTADLLTSIDARVRRKSDNIDIFASKISPELFEAWADRIGMKLDLAENGDDSSYNGRLQNLSLEARHRLRDLAYLRYGKSGSPST